MSQQVRVADKVAVSRCSGTNLVAPLGPVIMSAQPSTRSFGDRRVFSSSVYYGPSHHRQFRIVITTFENGSVEVRFHGEVATSDADQVVVEFTGVQGRSDDQQPAIREAAQRVRSGKVTWLRPEASGWIVDGDALREKSDDLADLTWLTGTAAITPRYEQEEMLRIGNLASRGRVLLSFDEETWSQARKPWEKNWRLIGEEESAGGQGTVRRVESRTTPGQFGALKVIHDENQNKRERRYRLLREVQALEYMAGNGTPELYESNVSSYNDAQQILYVITAFIDGPTLSKAVNKKRFDIASARRVIERLSQTLDHLHPVGHKHRDLKPDNVILRNDDINDPVLVDFGMASAADDDDEFRTEANQEIGNRFLRLPEYAPGAHRDDPRSDITQLVALFYYMITGITPRVLVDSEGRKPHEREHLRLTALREQPAWPRLRSLFDVGFNVELDKRVQDLPSLRARLRALGEPVADPETLHEIERLAQAAAHPGLRMHAERHVILLTLSDRFVTRVRDILHNTNVTIETRDHLTGRNAEANITARVRDHAWPTVNVQHSLSVNDDGWHGAFHADDGQPISYLALPTTADPSTIEQSIDQGAARIVRNLVRYLNYKVQRAPELRRAATDPRTPITDLCEEYPIGINLQVQEDHSELAVSFQNNSGVTHAEFTVLLLFPLALQPTIDGNSSTQQEEKYARFTFTVTTPLLDRATISGPLVHLAGDPSTAPADSHIFFQLKAGDSQYIRSIKIEEVFGSL